ncbi:MAG: CCA tRNA nucleotidyltransferase [Sulfurimonas sp.]|nr:CCA tRNA nucleotidyltransferase [Sulfurimonas sp.]
MIDYPKQLNKIFDKLSKYNAKAVLVGGYVRDQLTNTESKDVDIEVYNISSFEKLEEILREFGDVNSVGKSFGVCKLQLKNLEIDFSLPRIDSKAGSGHRGFEVAVNPDLDFKTAASRRDFTINAIGYDVKYKKILDPFDGIKDLKSKILRAVDKDKFIDDPLRVLRAAQFCARFGLKIDKKLLTLCKNMVSNNLLDELPKERIFEEIKKLLLKSKKPSIGFELLKEFGTNFYTKNIYVADEISKQLTNNTNTNIILMLAALCYDYTPENTTLFIQNLTNEKELLARVLPLIKNHDKIEVHLNNYKLYKLATEVKIEELLILSRAIYVYKNCSEIYEAGEKIYKKAKELNILKEKLAPLLRGENILSYGIEPSPKFSEILNLAYEAQMSGKFHSGEEAQAWLMNYLNTHS